jgi:hypothetical protein
MNKISGKSSSFTLPSALSSSKLITIGVETTWLASENGLPTAARFVPSVPPQWNSSAGGTSSNATGGSVHVGAVPRPTQVPASHVVCSGQSQSSSQSQPALLGSESSQLLVK